MNLIETGRDPPDKEVYLQSIGWVLNPGHPAWSLTQDKLRTQVQSVPGGSAQGRGGTMETGGGALPFSLADFGSAFSRATPSGKVCRGAEGMAKLGAVCVPELSRSCPFS